MNRARRASLRARLRQLWPDLAAYLAVACWCVVAALALSAVVLLWWQAIDAAMWREILGG